MYERLFIAEKPALAKVIAEALGNAQRGDGLYECGNDCVTWCIGHLLELSPPESHNPSYKKWAVTDLPLNLRPQTYQPIERTKTQFNVVKKLLSNTKEVIHAGDPDDEGQLLVDEVLLYCHNKSPVKRVLINDLNVNAAKKALLQLKDNSEFYGLSQKALARSVGDQIYGFNLTRAYTLAAQQKGLEGVLSVGRVQTPILGLIVNRYLLNKNHAAAYYYSLSSKIQINNNTLLAKYVVPGTAPVDEKGRIIDAAFTKNIETTCIGQPATLTYIKTEEKKSSAPLPFSLLDLQAKMSREHDISGSETLEITQTLREAHKAITYNRSDCSYLSSDQFAEAPETLSSLINTLPELAKCFDLVDKNRKSRAFDDSKVSAHTAIIPTNTIVDMAKMSTKEKIIYKAIVLQYIAQFLPEKAYLSTSAIFDIKDNKFTSAATKTTNAGWSAFIKGEEKEDDSNTEDAESNFNLLEKLKENDTGLCEEIVTKKEKTKPLPIYTEATLLKDLQRVAKYVKDPRIKALLISRDTGKEGEHGGLGTPATRASMLDTLKTRGFYTVEKKKFIPTELGISFIATLPSIATEPDMTALWHEQQQQIEEGTLTTDAFLDELEVFIAAQISVIDLGEIKTAGGHPCVCGGQLLRKKGPNGFFWGCSTYPACKNSAPDKDNKPDLTAKPNSSNEKAKLASLCPKCKSAVLITEKLFACSGCDIKIWTEIAGKKITQAQAEALFSKGQTNVIKGFKSKAGKLFDATLVLNTETGKMEFKFS